MIKLNRILVPTDYSDHSENALRYGCELARQFGAELHLLYVLEDATPMFADPEMAFVPVENYFEQQQEAAEKRLSQLPGEPWGDKLQVVREVLIGHAFVEIIRYGKSQDIDLIVLGTHGRSGLSHMFLGSVAERVVRKANCPVLTVRHPEHEFVLP